MIFLFGKVNPFIYKHVVEVFDWDVFTDNIIIGAVFFFLEYDMSMKT